MDTALRKIGIFLLIFALGMIVYFVGGYWALPSHLARTIIKILLPLLLLAILVLGRRRAKFTPAWDRLIVGFLAASTGFLASWLVGDLIAAVTPIEISSVRDIALLKFSDALPLVIVAYIVARLGGLDRGQLYVAAGRTRLWLAIGLGSMAVFLALFLVQAMTLELTTQDLLAYAPWTALFVLSNGLMEEFHFRGLLQNATCDLLGDHAGILCIALFFALVHAPVEYTPDIALFLAITFVLAIAWGYVIRKSEAIWGAVLFHAGADLLVIVGIFQTYGAI